MSNRSTSSKVVRNERLRKFGEEVGDWAGGSGPLYRQLSAAIARTVERGAVEPGSRLPAERALSVALSVSRGTVIAAYDNLVAEGLLERHPGSGTYTIDVGRLALPAGREGSALVARLVDHSAGPGDAIDLSISVLHDAGALPAAKVTTAELASLTPDTGYSPWGLYNLRSIIADLLNKWGLPTRPEQVVITTGAQQAISIAASCWVRPGDLVVVDDPTYPGAISAFTAAGAELLGVPVDQSGVQVEPLRNALNRRPALVYLQSALHSPTGVSLTRTRQEQIAALLAEVRMPVVEDIALAGLIWCQAAPTLLAAAAPDEPIAVIGSLSKLLWGGLRLGFVRAPEPVALRFARVKATHDLGSSIVSQLLGTHILRSPEWPTRALARNEDLRSRCQLLTGRLREALPTWQWTEPSGGLSLWVKLPTPTARPFAELATRHGVTIATADSLSATNGQEDRIRLSFAPPADQLLRGVDRLAEAWTSHCR